MIAGSAKADLIGFFTSDHAPALFAGQAMVAQ